MSDPEVVIDDVEPIADSTSEGEEGGRSRRGYALLAALILLLLLLCFVVTSLQVWVTRGPQEARFIARNIECLKCHTELIPDFSKTTVHNPFATKDCTTCHTPHGQKVTVTVTEGRGRIWQKYTTYLEWLPLKWWFTLWDGVAGVKGTTAGGVISSTTKDSKGDRSELVMPEEKLCWMCHGDLGPLLGDKYQHQPFMAGRCTNCHDPHASDFKALLTQAPNKLCFTCHPMGMELNRKQSHPPAKNGWCTDCHNPHASNFRGIIVTNQRELCFRCHPTVAVLSDMPVQHQPFLNDNCTGCHQPHGSDTVPLLNKPQPDLCYTCHPQIKNQFAAKSHHPVGVNLTCASCHDPHAAQYPGLINARDNAFCYKCHAVKQPLYDKSAHFRTLCIRCHTPHGSAYTPMLRAANPDLCLQCHTTLEGGNQHPVRPAFFDVHAQKGLTCTSSCHDPHGTQYNFLLKNFNFPKDGLCLQCHQGVGKDF